MATVTLKYNKLNSSLSVGDYVFYMTPTTNGSYTVEDSSGGRYLGRVKSISPPTNPPHIVSNVDMPFKNKRTSPNNFTTSSAFFNSASPSTFNVDKAANPDWPSAADASDFIYVAKGDDTFFTPNVTVVNPVNNEFSSAFQVTLSGDHGVPTGSANVGFAPTNDASKKIFINDTTGIEVGNTVTGTNIPAGTTVVSVVPNNFITVNNHLMSYSLMGSTIDLTFTGVDNFYTVVIEAESDAGVAHANDYFYFTKDRSVDSSGVLGYYAEVKMTNTRNIKSELYSVSSEIFESSK
jgi:hypothetical protein